MPTWAGVSGASGTSLLGSLGIGPGLLDYLLNESMGRVRPPVARVQTQAVSSGTGVGSGTGEGNGEKTPSLASMGKDDFLRLLLTELRMQDPTNPVDDKQFLAQLAQFSTLEQMTNLTSTLERLAREEAVDRQHQFALSLLGRTVEFVPGAGDGSSKGEGLASGRVEAVERTAAGIFLIVNGKSVPVDSVRRVLAGAG